jgi:metal-responsive CopG/Arc/MetJ family transcriptional regulator
VRSAAPTGLSQFLGVRLTDEELRQLDAFQQARGISTRSDAVRTLVRESQERAVPPLRIPTSMLHHISELVEDGWANSEEDALNLLATMGAEAVSRLHTERMSALRGAARDLRDRRQSRRSAERGGRELLER